MVDLANFRFDDSGATFDAAYKRSNAIGQDAAERVAGNALTRGNFKDASAALYGAGDLAGGSAVDTRAADVAEKARKRAEEQRVAQLKTVGDVSQRLALVHQQNGGDVNRTIAAFDLTVPQLTAAGEPAEEIAKTRAALMSDPVSTLTALRAGVDKELEPYTLGAGQQRMSGSQVIASVAPEQKFVPVPEGGKLVPVPQGAPPAGQPQAAPRASAAATVDPAAGSAPRNERNRNPGNIEDGPFARSLPGYAGSDGRFAIFDNDTNGANAEVALLKSYGKRGLNTVSGIINRWAPSSDSNPTPAYVDFVSKAVGVGPNQPLDMNDPAILSDVAMAIRRFEGTGNSASNGPSTTGQPQQTAAPTAQPGDPAGTIYGNPKPVKAAVRPATAQEKAAYGIPENVPAQMHPDGSIQPISGQGAALKPVPPKVQQGYIGNNSSVNQIDAAIAAIRAYPAGMGFANIMGDEIRQRADPKGVGVRAKVANIGSLLIHDRSGAAVTAAETPRLKPFVASANDTPQAAITKLETLKQQIQNNNAEIETVYGEDSGYRPMGGTDGAATSQPKGRPKPPQRGQIVGGYRYNGGPPGDKSSWSKQ